MKIITELFQGGVYKLKKSELDTLRTQLSGGIKSLEATRDIIYKHGPHMPASVLTDIKRVLLEGDNLEEFIKETLRVTGGTITKQNFLLLADSKKDVKKLLLQFHDISTQAQRLAKRASLDAIHGITSESNSSHTSQAEVQLKQDVNVKHGNQFKNCSFIVTARDHAFTGANDFKIENASFMDTVQAPAERQIINDSTNTDPNAGHRLPLHTKKSLATDSTVDDSSFEGKDEDRATNIAEDRHVYVSFASQFTFERDDDTSSLSSYYSCLDVIPESPELENLPSCTTEGNTGS